jgi:hypothetical protein
MTEANLALDGSNGRIIKYHCFFITNIILFAPMVFWVTLYLNTPRIFIGYCFLGWLSIFEIIRQRFRLSTLRASLLLALLTATISVLAVSMDTYPLWFLKLMGKLCGDKN